MDRNGDVSLRKPLNLGTNATLHGSYKYESLPSKTHIRLLIINPGTGEDVLSGSIKMLNLDDPNLRSFEAISYTWGSSEKTQSMLIDGRSLPVTTSLKEALLQTRLQDSTRTIWADSICINQDDMVEKGYQVSAMGRIYKASRRTLICLGLHRHHEHKARDTAALINDVDAMIEAVFRDPAFIYSCDSFPWPSGNDPLVVDSRWMSAWESLVHHPWFERGWVVQEAALGSDALIYWAGCHIEWMSLVRVDNWLYYRAIPSARPGQEQPSDIDSLHSDTFHLRQHQEAKTFVSEYLDSSIQALTTLSILQHARKMKLTDPRDRIYAFMALETSDGVMTRLNLQPDYMRPHHEVFYEFAVRYLEETSDLDILTHVDHDEDGLTSLKGIPSWVPQWDNGANVSPYHVHGTSCQPLALGGDQQLKISNLIDGSKLRLRGSLVGAVHFASRRVSKSLEDPSAEVLALWREIRTEINKRLGPFEEQLGLAFLDAATFGRHRGELKQWEEAKRKFAQDLDLNNEVGQSRGVTYAWSPSLPPCLPNLGLGNQPSRQSSRCCARAGLYWSHISCCSPRGSVCFDRWTMLPSHPPPSPDRPDHYALVGNAYVLRGTHVVDDMVHPLRLDRDHNDRIHEYVPSDIILV